MRKVTAKEIQEKVTAQVIAALESAKGQGEKWQRPWKVVNDEAQRFDGYTYQGINQLVLSLVAGMTGKLNVWGTPVQWGELAKKRGERFDFRGAKCVAEIMRPNTAKVVKGTGEKDDNGEEITNTFNFVKSYTVYPVMSISDVRGTEKLIEEINAKNALSEHETNAQAEAFITAQKAETVFGGNRACYSPRTDTINMPVLGQFDKPANYYATFIHELTHRTGHASRLNRPGIVKFDHFGSEQYAEEELIAELGAAFTCNALGIDGETLDSHAQYLDAWLKKLQSDKRFIFKAATAAQAAMSYMLKNAGAEVAEAT